MRLIYDHLKNFYPVPIYRKLRKEGELMLVMSEGLEMGYLNPTASFFLEQVRGSLTIEDIVSLMCEEYEVEREILQTDIINLVRDLQWRKLIKLSKSKREG